MTTHSNKPWSEACDINKGPILQVLREEFAEPGTVLEVGAGTGQHAIHFAAHMPHLRWQPSDLAENLPGMRLWFDEAGLDNIADPLELDVSTSAWNHDQVEYIYSANTVHIMSWPQVECLFAQIPSILNTGGLFALYGPFNYHGDFTSDSNARFDAWLKQRDPVSGVRDFDDLNALAETAGLQLLQDYEMPINNRTLVWEKGRSG